MASSSCASSASFCHGVAACAATARAAGESL